MKTTRVFSILGVFAVMFMFNACDPFYFYDYEINNQSNEGLYITVYSCGGTRNFSVMDTD